MFSSLVSDLGVKWKLANENRVPHLIARCRNFSKHNCPSRKHYGVCLVMKLCHRVTALKMTWLPTPFSLTLQRTGARWSFGRPRAEREGTAQQVATQWLVHGILWEVPSLSRCRIATVGRNRLHVRSVDTSLNDAGMY